MIISQRKYRWFMIHGNNNRDDDVVACGEVATVTKNLVETKPPNDN